MVNRFYFNDPNCYVSPNEQFNFVYFAHEVKYIATQLISISASFSDIKLKTEIQNFESLINQFYELQYHLLTHKKRISVFGIFKSGKSTFINAILGQKILPSRNDRATGVITTISRDSKEYAKIHFDSRVGQISEIISIDKIKKYILLDTSDVIAKPPENIKKVEIKLPTFFLYEDCDLTDTPGLLDNEDLTQLSYQEIERSDLAIIVLRADKLLSEKEQEAVDNVNNLLQGNVIFVINRMGIIWDDDDDEENNEQIKKILKRANKILENTGNSIIGNPLLFPIDALSVLKQDDSEMAIHYQKNINNFKLQLKYLFDSFITERLILLPRLGKIQKHLKNVLSYCQFEIFTLQEKVKELEGLRAKVLEKRNVNFLNKLESIRLILEQEKQSIFNHLKTIINEVIGKAKNLIKEDKPIWVNQLKEEWNVANKSFIDYLNTSVINCNNKIDEIDIFPEWSYSAFLQHLELEEDLITNVSNNIGDWGSFTLKFARNVENFIYNKNTRYEIFNNVKKEVLQREQVLRNSVDQYFLLIEENVKIYERDNQPTIEASENLLSLYYDVNIYQDIILQSKNFLDFIDKIINDLKN
ncbi:dynamin family protein [Cyanobacterium aponinum FACHB-4101]|uniref:dynamin family protein n=1 Tax=Cyanobacterium aponinum TaxID=379064 RepID=UPI001680ADCC|nr:dynamin family protein [Cyanobacterium aponinum]MBD2393200.1 dynamin family protein [Cyanobacterium aponinum FACHB-4101]